MMRWRSDDRHSLATLIIANLFRRMKWVLCTYSYALLCVWFDYSLFVFVCTRAHTRIYMNSERLAVGLLGHLLLLIKENDEQQFVLSVHLPVAEHTHTLAHRAHFIRTIQPANPLSSLRSLVPCVRLPFIYAAHIDIATSDIFRAATAEATVESINPECDMLLSTVIGVLLMTTMTMMVYFSPFSLKILIDWILKPWNYDLYGQ